MNELEGRVLKVSLARPQKVNAQGAGNRAGSSPAVAFALPSYAYRHISPLVWESEEWLQQHVKPLSESGGIKGKIAGNQPGVNGEEEAPKEGEMEE